MKKMKISIFACFPLLIYFVSKNKIEINTPPPPTPPGVINLIELKY